MNIIIIVIVSGMLMVAAGMFLQLRDDKRRVPKQYLDGYSKRR